MNLIFTSDDSPTGHLLRFLELSGLVQERLNVEQMHGKYSTCAGTNYPHSIKSGQF